MGWSRFSNAGWTVEFVGEGVVTKLDGEKVPVWRWRSKCAVCADGWSECTSPKQGNVPSVDIGRQLRRRCLACRPHRPRQGVLTKPEGVSLAHQDEAS